MQRLFSITFANGIPMLPWLLWAYPSERNFISLISILSVNKPLSAPYFHFQFYYLLYAAFSSNSKAIKFAFLLKKSPTQRYQTLWFSTIACSQSASFIRNLASKISMTEELTFVDHAIHASCGIHQRKMSAYNDCIHIQSDIKIKSV